MAQRRRGVFEDDEIDRLRAQTLARVGGEREPLSPAGVGAEFLAKHHGEIDVRPRSGLGFRPRAKEVDRGKVGVTTPGQHESVHSLVEVLWQWTIREHTAIVVRAASRVARKKSLVLSDGGGVVVVGHRCVEVDKIAQAR